MVTEYGRNRFIVGIFLSSLLVGIFVYRFAGHEIGVAERCYSWITYPFCDFRVQYCNLVLIIVPSAGRLRSFVMNCNAYTKNMLSCVRRLLN